MLSDLRKATTDTEKAYNPASPTAPVLTPDTSCGEGDVGDILAELMESGANKFSRLGFQAAHNGADRRGHTPGTLSIPSLRRSAWSPA